MASQLLTVELHGMRGHSWPKLLGQAIDAGALPQLRELSIVRCGLDATDYDGGDVEEVPANVSEWHEGLLCLVRSLERTPLLRL